MVRVDLFRIDAATGVTLNKMERHFTDQAEFMTSWKEMKTEDWSYIFVTNDSTRYSDEGRKDLQKLLLKHSSGEA